MKKTDTLVLSQAMEILSRDIHCEDGVATAAILEASQQLAEYAQLKKEIKRYKDTPFKYYDEAGALFEILKYE